MNFTLTCLYDPRHISRALLVIVTMFYENFCVVNSRHIDEVQEDSQRRVSMLQDRLDSTINRYEEQLQLLRRQKGRLEDDLQQERLRAGLSGMEKLMVVCSCFSPIEFTVLTIFILDTSKQVL